MIVAVQPLPRRRAWQHGRDPREHLGQRRGREPERCERALVVRGAQPSEATGEPRFTRRERHGGERAMELAEPGHGRADAREAGRIVSVEVAGARLAARETKQVMHAAFQHGVERARPRGDDARDLDRRREASEHVLLGRDLARGLARPGAAQHVPGLRSDHEERRVRVPVLDRRHRRIVDAIHLGEHAGQYTDRMRPAEQMRSINLAWLQQAAQHRHLFRQEWLGERFFHLPGDMVALQHLFWQVRPEVAVLTGVAAGGGPIFAASMLEMLGGERDVIAIDPVVHAEVRTRFASHPHARRIELVEGSTIAEATLAHVRTRIAGRGPVMVVLDHDHTHAHVLRELELYAELVSPGSYLIVLDTIMEDFPADYFAGKRYGKGNNPGTALRAFLAKDDRFEVDRDIEDRVLMTLAPGGFLRRAR